MKHRGLKEFERRKPVAVELWTDLYDAGRDGLQTVGTFSIVDPEEEILALFLIYESIGAVRVNPRFGYRRVCIFLHALSFLTPYEPMS